MSPARHLDPSSNEKNQEGIDMQEIAETTPGWTTEGTEETTLKAERIQETMKIGLDRRPTGRSQNDDTEAERDADLEALRRRRRCA